LHLTAVSLNPLILLAAIFEILSFARRQTALAARINFVRRSGDSLMAEGVKDFSKLRRNL